MDKFVVSGAMAMCSKGVAPSALKFPPMPNIIAQTPMGNITAMVPMMNVMPFGMCTSPANPKVAAATAAAMGVLTPQPCLPAPTGPWAPGSKAKIGPNPGILASSKLTCAYAGQIKITVPGQTIVVGA
jgi:hypothetical protein